MSIRFFRIWINWLYWTEYIIVLYLHGFCYFAVSFAIFWRPEFILKSWCLGMYYLYWGALVMIYKRFLN